MAQQLAAPPRCSALGAGTAFQDEGAADWVMVCTGESAEMGGGPPG